MKSAILSFYLILSALSLQLSGQTVYVTKTGEKYHVGNCQYLKYSKIATDLKDAIATGYTACKVCRPTQDITENTLLKQQLDEKPDPETTGTEQKQCTAYNPKGKRCPRMSTSENGKCALHEQ